MMNSRATVVPSEERDNLLQAEIIKFFQDGEDEENKNSLSFELPPGLQTEFLQLLKNLPTTNTQDSNIKRIVALAKSIKAVFLNYQAEMQGILFRITDYNFLNYAITLYFNVCEMYGIAIANETLSRKSKLAEQLATALKEEGFDLQSITNNHIHLLVSKIFAIETYHFMLQRGSDEYEKANDKNQIKYKTYLDIIKWERKKIIEKLQSVKDDKQLIGELNSLFAGKKEIKNTKILFSIFKEVAPQDQVVADKPLVSQAKRIGTKNSKNDYENFRQLFNEIIAELPSEANKSPAVEKLREIFDEQSDKSDTSVVATQLRKMVASSSPPWTKEELIDFLVILIDPSLTLPNRQKYLCAACLAFKNHESANIKLQIAKLFRTTFVDDRKSIVTTLQNLKQKLTHNNQQKWEDLKGLLKEEELSGENGDKLNDLIQDIQLQPTQRLDFIELTTLIDIFFHRSRELSKLKGLSPIYARFRSASEEELQAAIPYVKSRFKENNGKSQIVVELISDALEAHKKRSQEKEKTENEETKREMKIHVQAAKSALGSLLDMPRVSKKDIERVKQQVADEKQSIDLCRRKLHLEDSNCGLKDIEALESQLTQIEIRLTREEHSIKALGEPFFSKKAKTIILHDTQNKISISRQIVDQLPQKLANQVNFDSFGFESKINNQEGEKHVLQKGQYAINTLIQDNRKIAQFIEHRTKSNRYQSMAVLSKKIDDATKTEKIGPHQDISSIYLKLADAQSLTFMRDNGKDEKVYIRAGNPPELVKAYMLVCAARGLDYVNESTHLQVSNKENIEFVKNQLIAFGEAEPRASLRSR